MFCDDERIDRECRSVKKAVPVQVISDDEDEDEDEEATPAPKHRARARYVSTCYPILYHLYLTVRWCVMDSAPEPEPVLTGANTTFDSIMDSEEEEEEEVLSIVVKGDE